MVATQMHTGVTLGELLPDLPLHDSLLSIIVTGLCLDSRQLRPGDLFFAIPGLAVDGRDFIEQASTAGAAVILAEAEGLQVNGAGVIPVAGLSRKISDIAGRFYGEPSEHLTLTGVTGTNGKTTCSQLLAQLFSLAGRSSAVIGTLGHGAYRNGVVTLTDTGMTTPDAVVVQQLLAEYASANVEYLAMEVSSHSLDQYRVEGLRFTTAVFTNLSRDHLDYHGDLVSYAQAKMRLFGMVGLEQAVINVDDPVGAEIAANLPAGVELYGYSLNNSGAAISAMDIKLSPRGLEATVHTPWGEGQLSSSLLGRFNLENLLAVLAVACIQGLSLETVLSLIPRLQPVVGRMELVGDGKGPQVVIDYAHTPDALQKALLTLRDHCEKQLWCVFGCGGNRDAGKRPQMGGIAARYADRVVVTSDNPRHENADEILRDILSGITAQESVEMVADRAEAIRYAIANAADGDVILVAGKGHEDYQLIGDQRLPFSDHKEVRLALRQRGGCQ